MSDKKTIAVIGATGAQGVVPTNEAITAIAAGEFGVIVALGRSLVTRVRGVGLRQSSAPGGGTRSLPANALRLPRTGEMDDHRVLYLFLYDAWMDLYGREFADRMVATERQFRSTYDYDAAWTWALAADAAAALAEESVLEEQRRGPLKRLAEEGTD